MGNLLFLRRWAFALTVLIGFAGGEALAQERGFRLHRYEGTAAGSSQFLVERPWYSGTRYFAVGLTGDYSHRVLVPRLATGRGEITPIVSDAFLGHLDVAGSMFDRVLLSASLPVAIREVGVTETVSQVGPQQLAIGDPRVGAMVRLFGQPERDGFSLHLGADVWVPIGAQATHQGDSAFRILPRAVLAGAFGVGRWTLDAGFLLRSYASYGPPALGMTAASEARAGLAIGVSLANDRLYIGPEAQFAVQVFGANAFAVNGMNLEVLGGLHYLIADHVLLGVAGGTAFFGAAGTPDARAMVRLAWAPRHEAEKEKADEPPPPKPEEACPPGSTTEGCGEVASADDADRDGVSDELDRCPFEPETKNGIRDTDGCPEFEMEKGAPLARVMAPKSNPPPKV
ncbi:MAG: hypothetical protein JNG84_06035, partial [Archangium sp.]|nr:hypothetical protein [Archangium sp.]